MRKYWSMKALVNRCESTWCLDPGNFQVYDHFGKKQGKYCMNCADNLVNKKTSQLQTGHNRRSTD